MKRKHFLWESRHHHWQLTFDLIYWSKSIFNHRKCNFIMGWGMTNVSQLPIHNTNYLKKTCINIHIKQIIVLPSLQHFPEIFHGCSEKDLWDTAYHFPRSSQVWLEGSRCHIWISNDQFYSYVYGFASKVSRSGVDAEEFWIDASSSIS